MRKVLMGTVGFALLATSAWSQPSSRDDREDQDQYAYERNDWRGSDNYGHRYQREHGWDNQREHSMRNDDDDQNATGARFRLRSGDTSMSIVCGSQESTRTCVDAALTLFNRLKAQQATGPGSTPPVTPSPSAPATPQ